MIEEIEEYQTRLGRLKTIKEAGFDPYPAKSSKGIDLYQAKALSADTAVESSGRIISIREMGKLSFVHLRDASGKMQIAISEKELGKDRYKFFIKNFDLGDFIWVSGVIFVTHAGEISILVKDYKILSKALLPLPEKFHGLTDIEIRYRKRYLDLLGNENSMEIAKIRSNVVRELRNYFDSKGFYEVETPVLQTLYGGALAKPFVTHHNALDIPLYLRIAPELYLKRLIVGGFEKVYEIAKCFRNEGIDNNHNPEFTQIEFYWAYADYNMLMDMVEDYLPRLIKAAGKDLKLNIGGQMVDFTPPYPRVSMRDLIKQYAKFDIEDFPTDEAMYKKAVELKVEDVKPGTGRGKLIDEIYKVYARPYIINPMFMIDHPIELSPLAKKKPDNSRYVERFQLLCVGGNELCNAFSELNDPLDQEERFKEQVRLEAAGDEESMPYDEDFVDALRHGMPPTAGLGMGIDRLIKLLIDADNLKEVILFPTMRPETKEQPEKKEEKKSKK
jgi:lysyl-tRNA synthetase class 2